MAQFEIKPEGFILNGKQRFLQSGEMHYFRTSKKHWEKHLRLAKEAGLDALTTYIPWSWHELQEGSFDLDGSSLPERDIKGFIQLCHSMGLYLIVKPGPYILAERLDQGIPTWLIEKHPDIQAQTPTGEVMVPYVCSFMHPTYLEYVKKWYDEIIPIIVDQQHTHNGPILMMQLCNEVGLQHWLAGMGDYHPETRRYYYRYLEDLYRDIHVLNGKYATDYQNFEEVQPPFGHIASPQDWQRFWDWHEFHRRYYWIYLDYLMKDLRQRGIQIPYYHNIPGWVYGRGNEFPVCITLYDEMFERKEDVLFGPDHIPENVDFRNFHDASFINGIVQSLQGKKFPLYSAEFQAGSREHCVRTYPNELLLFYKASLAYGLKGWNYYMFSQGENDPGSGVYGPTFYWDCPLDIKAKPGPLYHTIEEMTQLIRSNEAILLSAKNQASVGLAFYRPYYETEFLYPLFQKQSYFHPDKAGFQYDFKVMRDIYYFDGLFKMLSITAGTVGVVDLETATLDDLAVYKQLWILSLDTMNADVQEKILQYIERGGKAIIYPTLPDHEMNGEPCQRLKDSLQIDIEKTLSPANNKVSFFDLEPINVYPNINFLKVSSDLKPVAEHPEEGVCGVERAYGNGNVMILGTMFNYQIAEHLDVIRCFLERDAIKKEWQTQDPDVVLIKKDTTKGSLIFLLNFHPVPKKVYIENVENFFRIPEKRFIQMQATSGLILPYRWQIGDVDLIYATAEIVDLSSEQGKLKLSLKGPKGTPAELVLQLPRPVQNIT
ncbi:MAG: beta-galactosidase, partial [Chlamydiota bacterium]|nr:beta-galactosidase [Chlamydiota bacterium]